MKNLVQLIEKKKFIVICLLFFGFIVSSNFAKEASIDSLKQVLEGSNNDSGKAQILLQLARINNTSDKGKAIKYYLEVLQFEKEKYSRAVILDTIGLFNWQLGNFQESISYFKEALTLFSGLSDSMWLGKIYNNLGAVNWGLGNSNEALEYYHEGLKIRKSLNDMKGVSNILNNIGLIYLDWGLYDEAYKWHNDALDISLKIEDLASIAYSYSNIGRCFESKKEFETALKYNKLGYKNILIDEANKRSIPFFLTIMGRIYSNMGKLDSALYYHKKSFVIAKRLKNKHRIAVAEYYLGKTFFALNEIDSSNKYINKSYNHSIKSNYNTFIKENLFVLAAIEEEKGNYLKALKHLKNASELKDSSFNKEKIVKFTSLQVKYYLDQKSKENEILRKDNEIQKLTISKQNDIRNVLILSGAFVLIFLVIITKSRISYKKLSMKLKKSEMDLLELNANKDRFFSIISHDLKSPFGSILGITDMIVTDFDNLSSEEIREMIKVLHSASIKTFELLEGLLEWAQTQTGRMEYEIEKIDICENSIKIIELLKANAANKKISLENSVKENTYVFADNRAVDTIFRNLISNAIKFTEHGGVINVNAKRMGDEISISISDTGIGISEENIKKLFRIDVQHTSVGTNNETGSGIGLILCKELVEKNRGKIWVESEHGKGSKFVFTLPLES